MLAVVITGSFGCGGSNNPEPTNMNSDSLASETCNSFCEYTDSCFGADVNCQERCEQTFSKCESYSKWYGCLGEMHQTGLNCSDVMSACETETQTAMNTCK